MTPCLKTMLNFQSRKPSTTLLYISLCFINIIVRTFPCLLVGVSSSLVNSWIIFGQSHHLGHPTLCIHFTVGTGSCHLQQMGDKIRCVGGPAGIVNYEERSAWPDDVIDGEFTGLGLWGKCPCPHQHGDPLQDMLCMFRACGLVMFSDPTLIPSFLAKQITCLNFGGTQFPLLFFSWSYPLKSIPDWKEFWGPHSFLLSFYFAQAHLTSIPDPHQG